MPSLKRKTNKEIDCFLKIKLTCPSFHDELLKTIESYRRIGDNKVLNIFEKNPIFKVDMETLQKLTEFI